MSDTPGGAGEPGQEQPALEDRQPPADQDDVLATDVESEQISDPGQDEESEGAWPVDDAHAEGAASSALDIEGLPEPEPALVRTIEALLFLAADPLSPQELADAAATEELGVIAALAELAERYAPGRSGIHLRELGEDSRSPATR